MVELTPSAFKASQAEHWSVTLKELLRILEEKNYCLL